MKKAYLLAHPAGHSLSPVMHNAAFADLGIDACYEALDVAPAKLTETVASLRQADVLGANVSIPHKLAVMPLLDELSGEASAIGAVNTIINQAGRLLGHNTDAIGFLSALEEDACFKLVDTKVVMLGAGGASRAIAYALLKAGVRRLAVYNRTAAKVTALAADFASYGAIQALSQEQLDDAVYGADVLINTTSVGMEHGGLDPQRSPLRVGLLPQQGLVCDIIYRPAETKLLSDAKARGLSTQNGLPMLVYQGLASFERWTGHRPAAKVMMDALVKGLAAS